MSESKELKRIKKIYGEEFMHLCRELFPTILEQEGKLITILSSVFAGNSRTLADDIKKEGLEEEFKNLIYSKVDVEKEKPEIIEEKTPYELLEEAGYDLYECHLEEEIQSFKKYYKPGEQLCTFNGNRLDRCVVFWAVRKNVDEIKREDFKVPKREDEYGTSVMSIQFSKSKNSTVSIKNRYNHRVNNPDATYGNDLDRIIPGLTQSFGKLLSERGMELNSDNIESFELPGYTVAGDGKYYKYNMEINGIYYCPGNVIIDKGEVKQLESEKQVLMDYFILDKEKKTLSLYDSSISDSFVDGFENIVKIEVVRDDENERGKRIITITLADCENPIIIKTDSDNNIVGYTNSNITELDASFLCGNKGLRQLSLPNVRRISGDGFLTKNKVLCSLSMPQLTEVGSDFLFSNTELKELNLPNLRIARDKFLCLNRVLCTLNLPKLTEVGKSFLFYNQELRELSLPNLRIAGSDFIHDNMNLCKLSLPELEEVDSNFLDKNLGITELSLPNLRIAGRNFIHDNINLCKLSLPELEEVDSGFLDSNLGITELSLPKLKKVGGNFLGANRCLTNLSLPELTEVGSDFLYNNEALRELYLPKLEKVGIEFFLYKNSTLNKVNLPKLREAGCYFLYYIKKSTVLSMPNLRTVYSPTGDTVYDYMEGRKKDNIDSRDIAEVDKISEITTSEIENEKRLFELVAERKEENKEKGDD